MSVRAEPATRETLRDIALWSGVASLGLNLAAALILGFAWFTQSLGSDSCLGLCSESHIGNPVVWGLILTAGPAFYLAPVALAAAAVVIARRPRTGPSMRTAGAIGAGVAAFGLQWGLAALRSGSEGVLFPVQLVRMLFVLSLFLPVPFALPAVSLAYAAYAGAVRREATRTTVLVGVASTVHLAFGIYWWFFTERTL